jgi:hypothetical protein
MFIIHNASRIWIFLLVFHPSLISKLPLFIANTTPIAKTTIPIKLWIKIKEEIMGKYAKFIMF